MAFHMYCLVIPDAPPEYFIHQELFLPAKCLQQGQKLLNIAGLPLPIPSTRNHLGLLQGIFNMARILLGNAGPPLTIPSTLNHPFLLQGTINRASIMWYISNLSLMIPSTRNHHFQVYSANIMLVIAGLSFTVPSVMNRFSYSTANPCGPPSDFSIQQESSLSPPLSLKLGKHHVWWQWRPSDYFIHQE